MSGPVPGGRVGIVYIRLGYKPPGFHVAKEAAEAVSRGSLHLDFVKWPCGDTVDQPSREETFDSQQESVVSIHHTSFPQGYESLLPKPTPVTHG